MREVQWILFEKNIFTPLQTSIYHVLYHLSSRDGGYGEVVNTPDCGSGMRRFEPDYPPHDEDMTCSGKSFFCLSLQMYVIKI